MKLRGIIEKLSMAQDEWLDKNNALHVELKEMAGRLLEERQARVLAERDRDEAKAVIGRQTTELVDRFGKMREVESQFRVANADREQRALELDEARQQRDLARAERDDAQKRVAELHARDEPLLEDVAAYRDLLEQVLAGASSTEPVSRDLFESIADNLAMRT